MRKPTSDDDLYRWWRSAVDGRSETHGDEPQCGFYALRERRGGPFVPVQVVCDCEIDEAGELASDERLAALFPDGRRVSPERIWLSLHPITRERFDALLHLRERDERMLATRAPVDLSDKPVRL